VVQAPVPRSELTFSTDSPSAVCFSRRFQFGFSPLGANLAGDPPLRFRPWARRDVAIPTGSDDLSLCSEFTADPHSQLSSSSSELIWLKRRRPSPRPHRPSLDDSDIECSANQTRPLICRTSTHIHSPRDQLRQLQRKTPTSSIAS
jgi:hypothetical protein